MLAVHFFDLFVMQRVDIFPKIIPLGPHQLAPLLLQILDYLENLNKNAII